MGRGQTDAEFGRVALLTLFLMGTVSCCMVYLGVSLVFKTSSTTISSLTSLVEDGGHGLRNNTKEVKCCKGIEHLELWGDAVKWGADFKVNSSEECCMACKDMCRGADGSCLCNSWVFCGDREACGPRCGECWLKRQKDVLNPEHKGSGDHVMWTSGLVFGKSVGIVGLKTEYGILRVQLLPDCAPRSVAYILELLTVHHCVGCHIYRAESRGSFWDSEGSHIENAPFGPPFALIQGTLEAHGYLFKEIPTEFCPLLRRGSVAWVGSGPEFFISLANHDEWRKAYTTFGFVLPEDMEIAEKIAQLPTKTERWGNIDVSVLEKPVPLQFQRINSSH
ncbi:Peptidyl-prolyl cis-trans isomerase [Quillaja saponaria]|uniref:Peptidyl-prolyl cis-trans isomerase n=1 Tax=Quillaja saponaria TaxID=32244 RepID=A0AAD7L4Z3_QUISA|nr:Peptidyl-prolyl cis-trans isomerase [Quillaja saponaria]